VRDRPVRAEPRDHLCHLYALSAVEAQRGNQFSEADGQNLRFPGPTPTSLIADAQAIIDLLLSP